MRPGEVGRPPDGLFELRDGAVRVPRHHQHRAQPVPQGGVAGRQLEAPAEEVLRRRQLPVPQRPQPARLVGDGALQDLGVGVHQRVRRRRRPAPPPPEMRLGRVEVAELSMGHGQRIVQARRATVRGQRPLQVVHGAPRVALGERRAPHAGEGRGRAAVEGEGARERLLGRVGAALVEPRIAQPHQGRQIRRPQLVGAGEEAGRRRAVAVGGVKVAEIVGPPHLAGREVDRAPEAVGGGVVVLGGHEHQAQLAEGTGEFAGRGAGLGQHRVEAGVAPAHLVLNRHGHAGEVRQGDRLPRAARPHGPAVARETRRHGVLPRRAAAGREGRRTRQEPRAEPVSSHVSHPRPRAGWCSGREARRAKSRCARPAT